MNQLAIDFTAPLARAGDPQTSHDAARRVAGSDLCRVVHDFLLMRGPMTTHEIAAQAGLSVVTVSPRIKPLRTAGLVEATGERREGRNVWRAIR